MAKRKRGTKTEAIKDMIAQHPAAKTSEVVKLLADKGIKVSANYVYTLKTVGKAKMRRAKRQKAMAAGDHSGIANPVELIRDVRALAVRSGGIGQLKSLVDILAE